MIVETYSRRLYWQIRRIVIDHDDTDDLLQDTFIKVYQSLKHFEGKSSLYSWMYRIATNEALNFVKKKKKNQRFDEQASLLELLKADPYFNGDEEYGRFLEIADKLPDKQKLVFHLKYFDKLKYDEIAGLLGGSVGSLKASYHHAVKKIEKSLAQD